MADSDVLDEEKLFGTFLQRGKAFELQETELLDYVDKQIRQAQERQDRQQENAKRRQLELAAIKKKEKTARQLELAAIREKEETKRQAEEEETKRQAQAQAHSQASGQQDGGDGIGQGSRVGHRPTLPKLPHLEKRLTTLIHTYSALKPMPLLLNGIELIGSHICLLC